MFFRTSQKRFPNLCVYVNHANSRQTTIGQEVGAVGLMTVAGLAIPAAVVLGFVFVHPLAALVLAAGGVASAVTSWRSFKKVRASVDRLDLEAAEANQLLGEALHRGKLHRLAGDATTGILEECAKQWSRARQALDNPFWTSPNLPPHYKSVREQTSRAVDRAMDEAVVLLHNELEMPYRAGAVDRMSLSELVEGVFGVQIPDMSGPQQGLPVAYVSVRQIAGKLKQLADNVESLTAEVAQDPSVRNEFHAESALDMCISDLESIRQAEKELRQNIGG